ncbi:MAG: porphobilinogen synthase [Planctomycetota bacterium]
MKNLEESNKTSPAQRPRRLRKLKGLRNLVRETRVDVSQLIAPIFVCDGKRMRREVASMPGVYQMSVDVAIEEAQALSQLRIPAIILFGVPPKSRKDAHGSEAWNRDGLVQSALKQIKQKTPELVLIADTCFCEYTSHGHCGVLNADQSVNNDRTLRHLARTAVSQARAGADVIAPSGMMDGMVRAIRHGLDQAGFTDTAILAYSAKYASAFYSPFRDIAAAAPAFGDRRQYQMDYHNWREGLREARLDVEEGADMVMVKPALAYLDVICRVRESVDLPVCAYNVSGEYSLVKAAAKLGWMDEKALALEIVGGIRRAGADIIITYWAKQLAQWLK